VDEQSTGRVVFDLLGIVCIALYNICTSHASQSDVDIQLVKVVVVEYNMDGRVSSLLSSSVYPRTSFKCSIYTSYHILPETTNPDMHMSSITLTYISVWYSFHLVLAGYFYPDISILISNQTRPTQSANISCCRVFIS